MAGVEALITFKVMAGRPRDFDDAITLLTLYPKRGKSASRKKTRKSGF